MTTLTEYLTTILQNGIEIAKSPAVVLSQRKGSSSINYGDFTKKALQLASFLTENTSSNESVGIYGEKCIDAYLSVIACMLSHRPFVPIYKSKSLSHQGNLLKKLQVKSVIACTSLDERHAKFFEEYESDFSLVNFSDKDILSSINTKYLEKEDHNKICYYLSTSGSTGQPKCVGITRGNFSSFLSNFLSNYLISRSDRISQTFGLSFDPCLSDIFLAFVNGATLYPLADSYKFDIANFISKNSITYWSSVPTLVQLNFQRGIDLNANSLPSLRYTTFTGESLDKEVCRRWKTCAQNSRIENLYGPIEATVNVFRYVISDVELEESRIPIGNCYLDHQFAIVDEELNEIKEVGKRGELMISGPQLAKEYVENVPDTQKKFIRWGNNLQLWYRTGDLVTRNAKGQVIFLGRTDWQLKIAGIRIEAEEIEYYFSQRSQGVSLIALSDSRTSPNHVIGVIDQQMEKSKLEDCLASMAHEIPPVTVPRKIYFLSPFPYVTSGKIDRRTVQQLALSEALPIVWP
ncbi:MAG: AMP-binding protein [Bdellovibrionales bacterium]|nr:AMP-binding protein [Bdellovibrionales bacterium]